MATTLYLVIEPFGSEGSTPDQYPETFHWHVSNKIATKHARELARETDPEDKDQHPDYVAVRKVPLPDLPRIKLVMFMVSRACVHMGDEIARYELGTGGLVS